MIGLAEQNFNGYCLLRELVKGANSGFLAGSAGAYKLERLMASNRPVLYSQIRSRLQEHIMEFGV